MGKPERYVVSIRNTKIGIDIVTSALACLGCITRYCTAIGGLYKYILKHWPSLENTTSCEALLAI